MVQFASYVRRVLHKTRLIFSRINGPIVRTQLNDLSQKIHKAIQPVFVSQKINQHLKLHEAKPPLVNQQSLVYQFKCDMCDADYVGFTRQH